MESTHTQNEITSVYCINQVRDFMYSEGPLKDNKQLGEKELLSFSCSCLYHMYMYTYCISFRGHSYHTPL